ncbi:MAG TPA: DUF2017 family protein [Actinotalea sp.]|nr:DUF2017 family protein [Actinotalea sp.]
MRPFVLEAGPVYVARLEAPERAVLLDVVDGVVGLLAARPPGAAAGPPAGDPADPLAGLRFGLELVEPPTDPALLRLLPDASGDPELAAELRRLTEADLRSTTLGHLHRLRSGLDAARPDLVVVPRDAASVAAALTDVRLVLASRLGIRTDEDAEEVYALAVSGPSSGADGQETRRFVAAVYAVLTELQESLVQLLVAGLPPVRGDGAV